MAGDTNTTWRHLLDKRQQEELRLAETYRDDFTHGTDGHHRLMLVARLAEILDEVYADATTAVAAPEDPAITVARHYWDSGEQMHDIKERENFALALLDHPAVRDCFGDLKGQLPGIYQVIHEVTHNCPLWVVEIGRALYELDELTQVPV